MREGGTPPDAGTVTDRLSDARGGSADEAALRDEGRIRWAGPLHRTVVHEQPPRVAWVDGHTKVVLDGRGVDAGREDGLVPDAAMEDFE